MVIVEHVLQDVVDGAVFACRCPWIVLVDVGVERAGLQQWIGDASCDAVGEVLYAWCHDDVLTSVGGVFAVEGRGLVVGLHVLWLQTEPRAVRGIFEGFAEHGGLARLGLVLHIDG